MVVCRVVASLVRGGFPEICCEFLLFKLCLCLPDPRVDALCKLT